MEPDVTLRPARAFLPPTNPKVHADTRRRVLTEETEPQAPPFTERGVVTAHTTRTTVGDDSTQWWTPPMGAVHLEMIVAAVRDAEDAWAINVYRGDVAVMTLEGDGPGVYRFPAFETWGPTDVLWLDITAGVSRTAVHMRFRGFAEGALSFEAPPDGGGGEG
jgi:hypothetical protein